MNLVPCVGCLFLNFLLACSTRACKGCLCRGRNRISILRPAKHLGGNWFSAVCEVSARRATPVPGSRPAAARVAGPRERGRRGSRSVQVRAAHACATEAGPRWQASRPCVLWLHLFRGTALQHLWSGVGTRLVSVRSGSASVTCCLLTPLPSLGRAS